MEDCIWQQGWAAITAESQSIIIVLQQGWQGASARQASAGLAAHRATNASIRIAPFLPMDIVYAESLIISIRLRVVGFCDLNHRHSSD